MPVYKDTNGMPRDGNGRVLHLGLANGELANRIIVVGHIARAELLAQFLEPEQPESQVFRLASDRGFTTFTGLFQGVRVSVISMGMGLAMMDFAVREARAILDGPIAMARFGTCGVLQEWAGVGGVGVASDGSILVQRNYAAFKDCQQLDGASAHVMTSVALPDPDLTAALQAALKDELGENHVKAGMNVTCDSFYGSQGRRDPAFIDDNDNLVEEVLKAHPTALTMEMETFQLFHLARCTQPAGMIRAAAVAALVANRPTGEVVDADILKNTERDGGRAMLRAIAQIQL
mmetsp:Transcript_28616/g.52059  ORF Transcript_28616/g.52059 Transcript_28616/m.52059 type:complete len:290 (-) Transcript_28616:208-1077(-)